MVLKIIIAVVVAIVITCVLYGILSTNRFKVVREKVNIKNLPSKLSDMRILHITDLHNSCFGKGNNRLAEKINELSPDYIFVSGDCIDRFSCNGSAFVELLENLNGKFPVFYSLGNHDMVVKRDNEGAYTSFYSKICSLGVVVLDNEYVMLGDENEKLYVFGVSSMYTEIGRETVTPEIIEEKVGKCPNDAPVFLMLHEGHMFDEISKWGADLTFSGHLHGGVVRLPFVGGVFGNKGKLFPKYTRGIYEKNGKLMNLSTGLGYTKFKFRFLNIPEMSLITVE